MHVEVEHVSRRYCSSVDQPGKLIQDGSLHGRQEYDLKLPARHHPVTAGPTQSKDN